MTKRPEDHQSMTGHSPDDEDRTSYAGAFAASRYRQTRFLPDRLA
jgi:hypothetical protein